MVLQEAWRNWVGNLYLFMTNAIKLTKKAFTWSVVLMTIAWSVGLSALIPAGSVYGVDTVEPEDVEAGDLIQLEGNSAVYYVNADLERMYFFHGKVFKTWFADFDALKTLAAGTDLDDLFPPNSAVAPRPGGSVLLKTVVSPKVYALGTGNMRHHLADEGAAKALFGDNWASKVIDVPDYYISLFDLGDGWDGTVLPDGHLVSKDDVTYHVVDGMKYMVDGDLPSFLAGDVMEVSDELFDSVDTADTTVTAASITEDPSQMGAMSADDDPEEGDDEEEVAAGEVTIALAADTPDSGYVYENSTHNQFTKINFTAGDEDVTIDSFVVERAGAPASDAAFSGINALTEDGTLLNSSYKTINSEHQVTFTNDVEVPANTTVSLVLVGKMVASLNDYGGEVPKLSLVSVDTDADVNASLPITGNPMTLNSTVTVGVAIVSENPDLGTLTEEVGTNDVELLNVKIENDSANNIDLAIKSMRFNNVGNADDGDVENLELVVDGNVVATSEMVSNYVYFDLSDVDAATIVNGKNETFLLRGDIVGGSGRTLDFDIKKADDIFAYDLLNEAYVTPSAAIDSGRTIIISRGTLNVSKTNTVQAQNIPEDTTGLELGSWNFKVQGEPITVASLSLLLTTNGGSLQPADFTQMKLVDSDGTALTGTFASTDTGTVGAVTTTDSFTLPEGDNEITLVGKLNSDGDASDWIEFGMDLSYSAGLDATGDTTGDAITVGTYAFPNANVSANRQTISAGTLGVTTLSLPAGQTVAAGVTGHLFSTISFDGSDSSEDVNISSFHINVTTTAAEANQLQNITFKVNDTEDGSYRTLGTVANGTDSTAGSDERITVTLPTEDQITVAKGTTVLMEIYADISAGTSADDLFQVHINSVANDDGDTSTVTAQGKLTGATPTVTYSTAEASVMTVGTAGGHTLVSLASDSQTASLMAAGLDVDLAAFKFTSTSTEDVELDYLYLTQNVTDTSSSSFKDYDFIWFEDESGAMIAGTKTTPTSTFPKVNFSDNAFVVDKDDTNGVTIYLKGTLAAIGGSGNGTAGNQVGYKIAAAGDITAKGDLTGIASSKELSSGSAPTGKTHYVYKSYPKVDMVDTGNTSLTNTTEDLFSFTVSAVNNDIALNKFAFDITTSTASVTNIYLWDTTGASDLRVNQTAGSLLTAAGEVSAWYTDGQDWDGSNASDGYSGGEVVVGVGAPRTYVLRASIAGAASGSSVTVGMAGDSAAPGSDVTTAMSSASNVRSDANGDFVWSDMSASVHTTATTDWTNGYLVTGSAIGSTTGTSVSVSF